MPLDEEDAEFASPAPPPYTAHPQDASATPLQLPSYEQSEGKGRDAAGALGFVNSCFGDDGAGDDDANDDDGESKLAGGPTRHVEIRSSPPRWLGEVELPPHLELSQGHGKVSWSVRGAWELLTGWYHDDTVANLYHVPESAIHPDLVELAGATRERVGRRDPTRTATQTGPTQ